VASGWGRFDAKDGPVGDGGGFGFGMDFDDAHFRNSRLFQIGGSMILNAISNLGCLQDLLPFRRCSQGYCQAYVHESWCWVRRLVILQLFMVFLQQDKLWLCRWSATL